MHLGAGRQRVEDGVDPLAGIVLHKKIGDFVDAGDILCTLHTNIEDRIPSAVERAIAAFEVAPDKQTIVREVVREGISARKLLPGLVSHIITTEGVARFPMEEFEDIIFE